ncbi:hypothetical protein F5Y10DRAFT_43986 [Nemania abortiva]|nr:hypothetical protein F5Y10DRAFT_43986 [Nemania abortiva]
MPRFPVNFRRKSTAADDQNGPVAEPSFRVLERPNSGNVKSFDGGVRLGMPRAVGGAVKTNSHESVMEDNLFAGLHSSRGSGSSNTTKTGSDNSSRHSNASMTPSSSEYIPPQEEWRNPSSRKPLSPVDNSIPPVPPVHKSSGFLKQAGRTFSFGGSKKHALPPIPSEESAPPMPEFKTPATPGGRSRATTASTVTSATPPKLEDTDFKLDLGGEWSSGMLTKFDKRSSVLTLKEREGATSRPNHPSPLHLDHSAPIEPPPKSWNSQRSNEGLLGSSRMYSSPVNTGGPAPPPPAAAAAVQKPRDKSPDRRESEEDSEDTTLLSDLSAASKFLSSNSGNRVPASQSTSRGGITGSYSETLYDASQDDGNIFDKSFGRPPRIAGRIGGRSNTAPQNHSNKVMTPEEFEKYRENKAKEERQGYLDSGETDKEDEEINYEDDEDDELERSKQIQKQRRKQEAHLSVYRQQMMKVTGESSNPTPRPTMSTSLSTPNLPLTHAVNNGNTPSPPPDGSDEDEEVPLAILAAHGFPNKNRPPTRLSTMGSQPNLRGAMQASATAGDGASTVAPGGRLPPFARKLPQDPYLGAGLINQPPRESIAFAGGAPAPSRPLPTGGLVGVIANEERARALRRGSPAIDNAKNSMPQLQSTPGFDPINGIPPQMMYPMGMQPMQAPMLTPGDQAQLQMNQQMTQFMQMQMQFMQMMASQNASHSQAPPPHLMGHMPSQSVGQFGDMSRNSFMGGDMARNSMMGSDMSRASFIDAPMSGGMGPGLNLNVPPGAPQTRTMSMVQPSSASWIQQPPQPNYLPSIQVPGGGYAPSIAPSERSNIGLPGRYRPVSSVGFEKPGRTSTMSAAIPAVHSKLQAETKVSPITKDDDDEDDDEGWAAMKAKREQKKGLWRAKKSLGSDIGAFIN